MKIRTGFVTNSSSTNFLILSKYELSPESLCKKMGFAEGSVFYSQGLELCERLLDASCRGYLYHGIEVDNLTEEIVKKEFGDDSAAEFVKRKKQEWYVYYGYTSSDGGGLISFFTTDSYLYKDKDIYIDGRDSTW